MTKDDGVEKIEEQVVLTYLRSGDFNGMGVARLTSDDELAAVSHLIANGRLDLVRGDGHPNPHIKAFVAESIATQLEKIRSDGLVGCLYPTPLVLKERKAGDGEVAPYTRELLEGAPQLSHRAFDLRALEWYRNDPRFEFDVDDIHGRIIQKEGTQVAGRSVVRDGLEFLDFGFAYDPDMHRAIAVFVRYLHDLPSEQQIEMKKHELEGEYALHPDFYRTQIIGDFPERPSIYDAFLEEKLHINQICKLLRKPNLFRTEFQEGRRPHGFGILLRPTKKEFGDFALQLDQLLSDDLNREFFNGDLELSRRLTNEEGRVEIHPKGTIQLLQEWMTAKVRPVEAEPMDEMFKNFRAVRKTRQKPAHIVEDNEFDQKYLAEQRELILAGYGAVHTLRMVLENHPLARGYRVPDHIRQAKVWTF
ncbi:MAG: hypothetical protein U1A24_02470 [Cypionkella sp.]|uniref:hypothetical protein n=1 Tax=Cypionkella sp. TaxID=2811411 RepID=UPI002ABBFB8E|nr:hypothetical protein [Cypionkella sp.]MDZ4309412.1 hypothetical protein [Cypionkella sp.]